MTLIRRSYFSAKLPAHLPVLLVNPSKANSPLLTHVDASPVVVIGGGPAGLMAAEVIAQAGFAVSVYDSMPSMGRKFLLAGVGGMNITHAESIDALLSRYANARTYLAPLIEQFDGQAVRRWMHELGIETFVGTSGRVFPTGMKAAPLLRAWLHRLRETGVKFYSRHRWLGWTPEGALRFIVSEGAAGEGRDKIVYSPACLLALGGASWARLGSDGAWVSLLRERNVTVMELQPSNCGFDCSWSHYIRTRCAGEPLTTIALTAIDYQGVAHCQRGECVITENGLEGTTIYALSAILREAINVHSFAQLLIDLLPDYSEEKIVQLLQKPRGKESLSNYLRKILKLPPVKINLLRELAPASAWQDHKLLALTIKALPVILTAPRPIDEAISSAGGVAFADLDQGLMLRNNPGVFCAGEMLDWEAPTGGYLLTACLASGRAAGSGVVDWLTNSK